MKNKAITLTLGDTHLTLYKLLMTPSVFLGIYQVFMFKSVQKQN